MEYQYTACFRNYKHLAWILSPPDLKQFSEEFSKSLRSEVIYK